jgi:hypothetical protein
VSHSFKSAGLYKNRKIIETLKFKKKPHSAWGQSHSALPK